MTRDNNKSYTRANIAAIIDFHKNSSRPPGTYTQQYHFQELARRFILRGDKLYWAGQSTRGAALTSDALREVIAREDVVPLLTRLYQDPRTRVNGRDRLFKTLADKYYGITKVDVSAFLNTQELHQVHLQRNTAKDFVPIVPARPYQRWQMDLIIMGEVRENVDGDGVTGRQMVAYPGNSGYKYVLTIIDTFTKFLHTVALKNRNSATIATAIDEIVMREIEVDDHHTPSVLQSDNEFDAAEIRQICVQYGIKQVFSKSHVSSSGTIERVNKTLKEAIWCEFTVNNDKKWLDKLQIITTNYNNTYHTVIKLMLSKLHPIAGTPRGKTIRHTKNNIKSAAASKIASNTAKFPPLAPGDRVRVLISSIDATVRAQIKSGHSKGYVQLWTNKIYTIKAVRRSASEFIRSTYLLNEMPGVWARDQLQKIGRVALNMSIVSISDVRAARQKHVQFADVPQVQPQSSPPPRPPTLASRVEPTQSAQSAQSAQPARSVQSAQPVQPV